MLQRTAASKSATNEALFIESTHIAETANAVLTIIPSAMLTPVPPTATPTDVPATPTTAPTQTSIPPDPVSPSPILPTPIVLIKGYPCEASVVTNRGTILNVVRDFPNGKVSTSVKPGETLNIVRESGGTELWYEIENNAGRILGWIKPEYVSLQANCPRSS